MQLSDDLIARSAEKERSRSFHSPSIDGIIVRDLPPGPRGSLLWLPEGDRSMEVAGNSSELALAMKSGFPVQGECDREMP
jgi:hypothetical protein